MHCEGCMAYRAAIGTVSRSGTSAAMYVSPRRTEKPFGYLKFANSTDVLSMMKTKNERLDLPPSCECKDPEPGEQAGTPNQIETVNTNYHTAA